MQENSNSHGNKFVFTITNHPYWGLIIEPYNVKITKKQQFSYESKKITSNNYENYIDDINETLLHLVKLTEIYSDESILKVFGMHKERMIDFLSRVNNNEFIQNHIRPFIEKKMVEVFDILAKNKIELFYKGDPGNLIDDIPISIIETPVEPIFNFEKHENETRYYLTLQTKDENISLTNKKALVLSNYPCLLLVDKRIYKFSGHFDSKKLVPFFSKEYIEIPRKYEKKYYETFIKNSIRHYKVKAAGFRIDESNEDPIPCLNFEANWENKTVLALSFKYDGNTSFSPYDKELSKVYSSIDDDNYYFKKTNRSLAKEKEYSDILLGYGLEKLNPSHFVLPGDITPEDQNQITKQRYYLLDWLSEKKEALQSAGFQFLQNHFQEKYFIGRPDIEFKTNVKSDWFDLEGFVNFGKHKIPFIKLKNNLLNGEREYLLPDGTIGLIPDEWFEKYGDIVSLSSQSKDTLKLKKYHYTILENLDIIKKQDNVKGVPFKKEPLPKSLKADLRTYQMIGFQWLCFLQNNNFGGCLADDMGLGKTIQALAALLKIQGSNNNDDYGAGYQQYASAEATGKMTDNPLQLNLFSGDQDQGRSTSIIIMPLSLIHNWINEIKKFAPSLSYFQYTGSNRPQNTCNFSRYDLILTTYGTLRSDINILKEFRFTYIILDESQVIKNAESKIFKAVKKLEGTHRLVLTGTPIENSLTDLWSQFSFLNPGLLGSLNNFKKEFVYPVERQKNELKMKKLQSIVQPFILRRGKNQVAKELPDLTEKVYYCEMTEDQNSLYERKKSEARNMILENFQALGRNKTKFLLLSSLTKLRLIANHPVIVENSYEGESGKFEEVIYNVNKVLSEDHKVLLFSQFVKHLNLFANYFGENGIPYHLLTGKVGEDQRKNMIDKFQNDKDSRVFLISLRAGGVGLNLTGADYVFMLDPWWNPAVEAQAINRAHRIGQDKKVFVYKFITRATVEQKIMALQEHKAELAGAFINQNNPLKSMQMDEIMSLL